MVTINASTTAGLVMTSDLSGVLTLQQNGVSLPNGGVAPAFSAYQSTLQALSASTSTKIQLQTEEFDTNSNYDNATNYRFTPTVAGYYQVNIGVAASAVTTISVQVYKNGSVYKIPFSSNSATVATGGGACLVYCNGSTDYIEFYATFGSALNTVAGSQYTYFQACLVRGA